MIDRLTRNQLVARVRAIGFATAAFVPSGSSRVPRLAASRINRLSHSGA